jgi:hypothetical protein
MASIMHVDVQALAPFSTTNPLHGWISIEALHSACALAGLAGLSVGVKRSLGLPPLSDGRVGTRQRYSRGDRADLGEG